MSIVFVASRARVLFATLFSELSLSPSNIKCLFIDTAKEKGRGVQQAVDDKLTLQNLGVHVEMFTFTGKKQNEITKALDNCNVIYIAGGNTIHLLNEAQKSGAIELISRYVGENKVTYIGSSAGAMLACKDVGYMQNQGIEAGIAKLDDYSGLGLIDFQPIVHMGDPGRLGAKMKLIIDGYSLPHMRMLLTNNQGILVKDGWMKLLEESA